MPDKERSFEIRLVRHILAATGWSGRELAGKAGVADSTIYRALDPTTSYIPNGNPLRKIIDAAVSHGVDLKPVTAKPIP